MNTRYAVWRLDHESREMSEKRETATADRYQTISRLAGVIASGRAEDIVSFSRNFGSSSQNFVKRKDQQVPCCRRRIGFSPGETPGLMNHRVSPVKNRSYAVVHSVDGIRLRQGGMGHPFWRKWCMLCTISAKKLQNVPCCRRRVGPFVHAHASFERDRVSPVMKRST
jgi:hypothetical protein